MSECLYQMAADEAEQRDAEFDAAEAMGMTVAEYRLYCDEWNADMAIHLREP